MTNNQPVKKKIKSHLEYHKDKIKRLEGSHKHSSTQERIFPTNKIKKNLKKRK